MPLKQSDLNHSAVIVSDRSKVRYTVNKIDGDVVTVYPEGGGFSGTLPLAKVLAEYSVAPGLVMRAGTVTADFFDGTLQCFSDGSRWNGWGMPYFLKGASERIAANPALGLSFDEKEDAYVWKPEQDSSEDDWEAYKGFDITIEGVTHHVYPIGTGSWTWDAVEFEAES